jgi:DNA polymerase-3 subunit gamma/tau
MEERSLSFEAALQDLGTLLHKVALAQTIPEVLGEDLPERAKLLELAQIFGAEEVQLCYQIALHGRRDLYLAPDEFAGFSMTLLRMLAFTLEAAPQPATRRESPRPTPPARPVVREEERPAETPTPATQTNTPPEKSPTFAGDWHSLVNQLKLGGMAKMLAQHCELKSFDNGLLELCVPQEHRHLMEKPYQDKLKAAVTEHFAEPVRLSITEGSVTGDTPAQIENREKQEKQSLAVAAIEQDPFVRKLVENFDAKVIESSIKPL